MRQEAARLRVAVIGGGASGIAAAEHLVAAGAHTTIFEDRSELGGIVRTLHRDGFVIDEGPDGMLASKPEALALCERVGVGGDLIDIAAGGALVMRAGTLVRLPAGMSGLVPAQPAALLRTPALSPWGRVRAMAERFVPARRSNADESIEAFFTRRFGREWFERLTEPLLSGIYSGDPARLSIAATFPALVNDERRHGSLLAAWAHRASRSAGRPAFRSLRRGMGTLASAAASHLRAGGAVLRLDTAVESIVAVAPRSMAPVRLRLRKGSEEDYDGIVIATPAHVAATLLQPSWPDAAKRLAAIEHADIDIVSLGYDAKCVTRTLDATGYVVPRTERREVRACSWSSVKWPGRAPHGRALFRVFVGGGGGSPDVARDDDALLALARRELAEQVGARGEPIVTHITRWRRATPQYHVGHAGRVEEVHSLLQRAGCIRLAGNYLEGVGLSDCVRSGQRAAAALLEDVVAARTGHTSSARATPVSDTASR